MSCFSSHLQHVNFQNTLTSTVVHNGLASADRLILGVVKVWGAGTVRITAVTLTDAGGKEHSLTVDHNLDTEVSRVSVCDDTLSACFVLTIF